MARLARSAPIRYERPRSRVRHPLESAMFYLAPHPKLDKPQRGSPRMFTIDWVEKYFSRVRPWHVVAIWTPFVLWMSWLAFARHGESVLGFAGISLVGVLAWTLLEYFLHRMIFHFKPHESSD